MNRNKISSARKMQKNKNDDQDRTKRIPTWCYIQGDNYSPIYEPKRHKYKNK